MQIAWSSWYDRLVETRPPGDDWLYARPWTALGREGSFELTHPVPFDSGQPAGLGPLDEIRGTKLDDYLVGTAGDDLIDGRQGADTMVGSEGNDTYLADNAGDLAVEAAGQGIDTVRARVDFVLSVNVENLALLGDADLKGSGNDLDNRIDGNKGANVLDGGEGQDVLLGHRGNDTLLGGLGDDSLDGGGDNDSLVGGAGADTLVGGAGNDHYVVDSASDNVVELQSGGNDTVYAAISWALGADLENLALTGSAAIDGTGNLLDNAIDGNRASNVLSGGDGNDTLVGHRGDDTLVGGIGTDYLDGSADADSLVGGAGADTMVGGTGNDTFLVDDAGDVMVELSDGGLDTVVSSVSWTLGVNAENLTLSGWFDARLSGFGNELANVIHGDLGIDYIDGGAGDDTIVGSYGLSPGKEPDTLHGGEGNDSISLGGGYASGYMYGGAGNDTLSGHGGPEYGEDGDDLLVGGLGYGHHASGNALYGGLGNDTLTGGSYLDGGEGDDVLDTTIGYNLNGGLGNDTITGSGLVNVNETLYVDGGEGDDQVGVGSAGRVSINAGAGNDVVSASGGNSIVMDGGAGDDQLQAYSGGGQAFTVSGGEGADSISANGYGGTASGGDGDDAIRVGGRSGQFFNVYGDAGNDSLSGLAGIANLTGGLGSDTFNLASQEAAWQDMSMVTDFEAGTDTLAIDESSLPIGNGDLVVDGATTITGPGGFDAASELVILTQNMAGSLSLDGAALAIGDANQAYAEGQTALFVVGNGSESWVLYFESAGSDADVGAAELSIVGHLTNGARPLVDDVVWTG
jgi:Ca2+-binding RTX toxin-like protein